MTIKYIAYHNNNPIYVECGKQLEASLQRAGIADYHIEGYNYPAWSFNQACAFKPVFILGCMLLYPDYERIVYLDIDSVMVQKPLLFSEIPDTYDIGVHYKDFKELLSGTIYIKNTHKMLKFVNMWGQACQDNIRIWDQKVLQELLKQNQNISVYSLPPEYCQIFDTMAGYGNKPVIVQMQASRLSRGIDLNHSPIQERAMWTQ